MKKIIFLIIASLMVLGLVLPGCGPTEEEEVIYIFDDGQVNVGLTGDMASLTGLGLSIGAKLAAAEINGLDPINIGGVPLTLNTTDINTSEVTDITGDTGRTALLAKIDGLDVVMGGFRTEAVENYRNVAMDAHKFFFDCGAATETLCGSVVDDYDTYKYFFKTTPYNEYGLATSCLKMLGAVAVQFRAACNMTPGANLKVVILSEDLQWAKNEQEPKIKAGLAALNLTWLASYFVSGTDSAQTVAALATINATYPQTQIIVPLYSAACGVAYAIYKNTYVPDAMSVGIVVYEQIKVAWVSYGLNLTYPNGPVCKYHVELDTWGDGVAQTSTTASFLANYAAASVPYTLPGGDYPLYTAVSYDACYGLKACLESVGTVVGGVAQAKAADMIAWYENPANAQLSTTGYPTIYPVSTLTYLGQPILSKAQKESIYGASWPYTQAQWVMPPHTTHDLVYGVGRATGLGCQWQWDAVASKWLKKGVWPMYNAGMDVARTDQYGNWNFAYNGTAALVIPPATIARVW